MLTSTTETPDPVTTTILAWRRRNAAPETPGSDLGEIPLGTDAVTESARLFQQGVRAVSIENPVDLTTPAGAAEAAWTLALIRELTSHAIEIRWRLRTAPDGPPLVTLSHLYPPTELHGADTPDTLKRWRSGYYMGRCFYRQGPNFVQVRDHRYGELHRFTIDDQEYLDAIQTLLTGGPETQNIPTEIITDFENESLTIRLGNTPWWAPYRLRRWPLPCWNV